MLAGRSGFLRAVIALFTDFGLGGPYTGQMKAVLARDAPGIEVIELMSDLPPFDPEGAGYLLAALAPELPRGTVFVCVVDPGVGSDERAPWRVEADGRHFVGPGNGLFDPLIAAAGEVRVAEILWRPRHLSATFHGRDLFAPVAARVARGEPVASRALDPEPIRRRTARELARVLYVDAFGNAITGLRAPPDGEAALLEVAGRRLGHALTFAARAPGEAFWHVDSIGLVEVSVNRGSAAERLALGVGSPVAFR